MFSDRSPDHGIEQDRSVLGLTTGVPIRDPSSFVTMNNYKLDLFAYNFCQLASKLAVLILFVVCPLMFLASLMLAVTGTISTAIVAEQAAVGILTAITCVFVTYVASYARPPEVEVAAKAPRSTLDQDLNDLTFAYLLVDIRSAYIDLGRPQDLRVTYEAMNNAQYTNRAEALKQARRLVLGLDDMLIREGREQERGLTDGLHDRLVRLDA